MYISMLFEKWQQKKENEAFTWPFFAILVIGSFQLKTLSIIKFSVFVVNKLNFWCENSILKHQFQPIPCKNDM